MNREYETDTWGVIVSLSAVVVFTCLSYPVIGLFSLIVGPLIGVFTMRPVEGGPRCMGWQREKVPLKEGAHG